MVIIHHNTINYFFQAHFMLIKPIFHYSSHYCEFAMKKDSLICFRVSKNVHDTIAKIAQEEKRSLSSIIDIALNIYIKERQLLKGVKSERRRYPRRGILAPALIKQHSSGETKLETGSITDISLSGVRILIPKEAKCDLSTDPQAAKFEIIFTLPNEIRPIYVTCESCRIVDSDENIHVGASFIDANFHSYKALQKYLI